jgi:hypothetical protein
MERAFEEGVRIEMKIKCRICKKIIYLGQAYYNAGSYYTHADCICKKKKIKKQLGGKK